MKYILIILAAVFGLSGVVSYATVSTTLGTTVLVEPISLLLLGITVIGVAGILRKRLGRRKSH